jgi:sec-independent protein translocase protein TatA
MFADLFTGWHLIIVFGVIVLLFGATKLPALAKGVGQSIKIFKTEVKEVNASPSVAGETPAPAPVAESTQAAPSAAHL